MKAIIVEDEKTGLDNLIIKLTNKCPVVDIIDTCSTGEEAIQKIAAQQPDLVFLDVNLGSMTGFDVLARLQHINFKVIFTTAYDNYAIKAIKNNALDYLIKPIDEDELKEAVQKAWRILGEQVVSKQIAVPVEQGIRMISSDDIIWCDANDNSCFIHLNNVKEPLKIPRSLNDLFLKLPHQMFFRTHRSHVVNKTYIDHYSRDGFVAMKNKKMVSVARNNKDEFLSWLGVE
jgi:two-component system, LytTR family, response regulator